MRLCTFVSVEFNRRINSSATGRLPLPSENIDCPVGACSDAASINIFPNFPVAINKSPWALEAFPRLFSLALHASQISYIHAVRRTLMNQVSYLSRPPSIYFTVLGLID